MPAKLIDGTAIGAAMRKELAAEIAGLKRKGITPGLAVVLVGLMAIGFGRSDLVDDQAFAQTLYRNLQ